MVQDIKNWRTDDFFPDRELREIAQVSLRIKSLIARRREHRVLATNYLNVAGVADMVDGLEYHFSRILDGIEEYADTAPYEKPKTMHHDAVAYLNRVGQIYAFMRSPLMRSISFNVETNAPTFSRLILFRNKFSAHRSLDAPRNESEHEQTVTALSFHGGTSLCDVLPDFGPAGAGISRGYGSCRRWCR